MFKKLIQRNFIPGLLVILPIAASVWVIRVLVGISDGWMRLVLPERIFPWHFPGLGLVFTIGLILCVGFLARYYLGKMLIRGIESLLERVPVINRVYSAVKQVLESFMKNRGEQFRSVVAIEFPHPGSHSIGFVTATPPPLFQKAIGASSKELVFVFIPTVPNPTSGFLMGVEKSKVKPLDINVEDAFKLIISGGIILPDAISEKR